MTSVLSSLMAGVDMSERDARHLAESLLSGQASDVQVAGILVALQIKGATGAELAGMASVLRERAVPLSHAQPNLVDTCGTGGGRTTWNLSTGAALVAAGAGAKVAKHGNRSVTSSCGSADVLERLGVDLHADPERLARILESVGIVFLFAPAHHGAMRSLAEVRKGLGVRTVFNQLGPLANPAGATRQLIGVYDRKLLHPMGEALAALGAERAFVVHSDDGMDEVSPCAATAYCEVVAGTVREGVFEPGQFLDVTVPESALRPGADIDDNAALLVSALEEPGGLHAAALVPNAAVTLVASGLAEDILEGARLARRSLESGEARRILHRLVEASSS